MRRRTALYGLGSLGLGVIAGCGQHGHNPFSPEDPDAPLRILDGRTGNAVAATTSVVPSGTEFAAPAFLTLRTGWAQGDVFLWPDDSRMPAEFTRALVFPEGRSHRWSDGIASVGLVPVGEFASGRPLQALEEGAALASAAHPHLTFAVGSGQVSGRFEVVPGDETFRKLPNAWGFADMKWSGRGAFTRGRVGFSHVQPTDAWRGQEENWWVSLRLAIAHELGHFSGLMGHVPPGQPGLMGTNADQYRYHDFIEAEKLAMVMQYRRQPGTSLMGTIEDETGVSTQSVQERSIVIVD